MKLTLLDMTQNILSALNSDEVNSISDTTESMQVAELIKSTYFNIINRANLPEHYDLFSLVASNDITQPCLMYKPDNVRRIEWIKYNFAETNIITEPEYNYVTILPLQQFLDMVHGFNPDETDVEMMTINDYVFYYKNNKQPSYCTILKDSIIIFDSFDESLENTLEEDKSQAYGQVIPTWTMSDSFIPDLDAQQFPLLLSEAKALAFIELKQTAHESAERESRRQWRSMQRSKHLRRSQMQDFDELPNYARR